MTTTTPDTLVELTLDLLAPHPHNIRRRIGDVTELAKSIAGTGILEPLLVLPAGGDGLHHVIAGHRRLAAAGKANLTTAPCIVRDLTEAEVIEAMLVENMQRSDVTAIEEAKGYGRLVELESTVASIAKKVGRSQAHVKGRLALLVLPDALLDLVDTGAITLDDAATLAKHADDEDAMAWLTKGLKSKDIRPSNADWQIREYVEKRNAEKAMAAIREKVEAAGHTLYEPPTDKWGSAVNPYEHSTYGTMQLTKACTVEAMGLTDAKRKAHADEPCAAIWIKAPRWGAKKPEAVPVCTSPKRHTTKAPKSDRSTVQMKPSIYAKKDNRGRAQPSPKLAREMKANRSTHLAATVAKVRKPDDDLLRLALAALDERAGEGRKFAGCLLDPTADPKDGAAGYEAWSKARDGGEVPLPRLLAAMALGQLQALDWSTEAKGHLLTFLVGSGYEPVDGEAEWLELDLAAFEKRHQRVEDPTVVLGEDPDEDDPDLDANPPDDEG